MRTFGRCKLIEGERKIYSQNNFKNFVSSLICLDSTQRLTISEIKAHPWYNGETLPVEQIAK